jgi:CBS domain-containing protein
MGYRGDEGVLRAGSPTLRDLAEGGVPVKVNKVMTAKPACCSPDTRLQEVAHLMVAHDCGEIPVVDGSGRPLGVVTDRDITVRTVAQGKNPLDHTAADVMTSPAVTVSDDCSLEECTEKMEQQQLRRMLVVDDAGCVCGIVSQADVALNAGKREAGELVRDVSKPTGNREPVSV